MRSMLRRTLLMAAIVASNRGVHDESGFVRHHRRGKRLQSPEEKQVALAEAEEKRERKRTKRFRDNVKSFSRNHCLSVDWYHWKTA
jgi:hypothetical protein